MNLKEKFFEAIAVRGAARRTGEAYWDQVLRFYRFVRKPASQWDGRDVERWMAELHRLGYARKSRKQALCAVVFVFKRVLKVDLGQLNLPPMPKERQTLKIIPTREEIGMILRRLSGQVRIMAGLMYGAGLRVNECCTLRVQDVDLASGAIMVHGGKGDKSRRTLLPMVMRAALDRQVRWRADLHARDLANGAGRVELPGRLAIKYRGAERDLRWQYLFPSTAVRDGVRWHATDESVAKQMRAAGRGAGILKRITPHTLRHAFATHAMRMGTDPRTVQDLLGHESLETTMIYLHGDQARGTSPLDGMLGGGGAGYPQIAQMGAD